MRVALGDILGLEERRIRLPELEQHVSQQLAPAPVQRERKTDATGAPVTHGPVDSTGASVGSWMSVIGAPRVS